MKRTFLLLFIGTLLLILSTEMSGQERGVRAGYQLEGKDTLYQMTLREVYHFSWESSKKRGREWREFYRLVYNFNKTYPYALIAKAKIAEADSVIKNSNFTAREEERYIKEFEKALFKEFERPLRKMTITQGRLLLKLIDREVGQNSYYIIRNYKGGAAAGFWQGVARIFGSSLKQPYDRFGEDKLTEELVQMYQRGSFEFLYYSIFY